MATRNRIHHQNSDLSLERRREMRGALLLVVGPLKCRPTPRDAWDALGDKDAELQSLWLDKPVLMCRQALEDARRQGPDVFAVVRQRVELFWAEMAGASLDGFVPRSIASLAEELRQMQREVADVIGATADVSFDGSDAHLDRLANEGQEAINEIADVVDIARARRSQRRELVVT